MLGFTDKDTLRVRSDQFSPTGKSTSLIIPSENLDLLVHSSPYKSRNFYSGVIIEKTADGYKVKGYDKNFGYFNTLAPNLLGFLILDQFICLNNSLFSPNQSINSQNLSTDKNDIAPFIFTVTFGY